MIDLNSFVRWAEDRFQGNVIVKGNEVKINSIFTDDTKFHLWCNVEGGKHHRENGCYRCFKTENKGTLVGLVMLVDGCTYEEAKDTISGQTSIRILEERLHEFFANKENNSQQEKVENTLKLPNDCYLISEMSNSSYYRMEAEDYLNSRKLPIDGLMYCTHGEYRNRIFIPYYDKNGKLIYWNSRHVNNKAKLRYRGPDKTCGVGKNDVVYCPGEWPKNGEKIHLTEGEFNAIVLQLCGLNSIACGGKVLSDKQLEVIKPYKICLCLDNDDDSKPVGYKHSASPGFQAMLSMARKLIGFFISTSFVRPPKGYKDWNDMLIAFSKNIIIEYIHKYEKVLDPLMIEQLMCL